VEGSHALIRREPTWDWELLRQGCLREARRVLGDPHEAEEAVQEAMARAWRQRHNCRDRQAPAPWLRRIARNEALRLVERRAAWRFSELEPEVEPPASDGADLERSSLERVSVSQALELLEPEERELVTLRYMLDLGQPEIARRLGMPEATVRVKLHRIRKRLRALIWEAA
jgi:RNA polymerase sigma-70 factor, ECF subfamily